MHIFDTVTGLARAALAGKLAKAVAAMKAETSPVKRIPLAKQVAELLRQLTGEAQGAKQPAQEMSVKERLDREFNVSGRFPEKGVDFMRSIRQMVTDGEYKGQRLASGVAKSAERLERALLDGDVSEIERIRDQFFSEWNKSKSRAGTQRDRFVSVDTAKVELYTKAFAAIAFLQGKKDQPAPSTDDGLSDDPSSPNYRYKDTGYIAGSRKEMATEMIKRAKAEGRGVLWNEIDWDELEKNPRVAADMITKSNLFGVTDWDSLKENGMEPAAGFLIDRVYASIGPQPVKDGPMGRKDYAMALENIRARLEKATTAQDVTDTLDEIKSELEGSQLNAEEAERYEALKAEAEQFREKYLALKRPLDELKEARSKAAREMNGAKWEQERRTRRGWKPDPEIEAQIKEATEKYEAALAAEQDYEAANPDAVENSEWVYEKSENGSRGTRIEKNPLIAGYRERYKQMDALVEYARMRNLLESPITRGWATFGERFFALLNWRRVKGSDAFASHVTNAKNGKITDWSWAEKDRAQVKRATKEEVRFQMRVAENFKRRGGKPVSVKSTTELKKMIGLRDIQSGNWVLDDPNSAKFHIENAAAAMSDLGDILGIDPHALGLGGRLAIAFGARGKGNAGWKGAASAHYEPVQRVINITKMRGGGSLGHEWFHSLDNMLPELMGAGDVEKDYHATVEPSKIPDPNLRSVMSELATVMMAGDRRLPQKHKIEEKWRKLARHNIDERARGTLPKIIKDAGDGAAALIAVEKYFENDIKRGYVSKNFKDWQKIAAAYYAPAGKDLVFYNSGPKVSNFMAEAVRLDGGERGKYWSKPEEMAARAFQAYLEDSLANADRQNDYLSALADNKYHIDPLFGIEWKPFPEGEERKRFNAAFDKLFAAIREAQVFEKATANKELLDSIFGTEVIESADS